MVSYTTVGVYQKMKADKLKEGLGISARLTKYRIYMSNMSTGAT